MSKIKTLSSLKKIITRLKRAKKRIVFTNGCFDIFHPGHLKILHFAKQKGDTLIVAVNSDSSVKKIKGSSRPIFNEKARAKLLESLQVVDYVIIFKEDTPYNLIKLLKPHILIKGGDWKKNAIVGSELVDKIYRVKLYRRYSTSNIIKKVKK